MLSIITCILHNLINLIILYKQFNFRLAPQTFGLVTSSNSLPKGQPYQFAEYGRTQRDLARAEPFFAQFSLII